MKKSILEMSSREVRIEKLKLQRLGLLEDSCWKLGELLRAVEQTKRGAKNYERV